MVTGLDNRSAKLNLIPLISVSRAMAPRPGAAIPNSQLGRLAAGSSPAGNQRSAGPSAFTSTNPLQQRNTSMKTPLCPPARLRFTGALFLAASLTLTARADYSSTVISQGPLGYWRLNETTQPPVLPINATNRGSLGSAADGSILSGATRGEPGPLAGSADKSYRFTNPGWSVTDFGTHVDVPANAALNPSNAFTVEFWANPSSVAPDLFSPVCSLDASQNGNASREGYLFYYDGGGSRWQFRMGGLSGYGGNTALGGTATAGA